MLYNHEYQQFVLCVLRLCAIWYVRVCCTVMTINIMTMLGVVVIDIAYYHYCVSDCDGCDGCDGCDLNMIVVMITMIVMMSMILTINTTVTTRLMAISM